MGALGHAVGSDDVREGRARHGVHLRLGRIGGAASTTGCTGIVGAVRAAVALERLHDGGRLFGSDALRRGRLGREAGSEVKLDERGRALPCLRGIHGFHACAARCIHASRAGEVDLAVIQRVAVVGDLDASGIEAEVALGEVGHAWRHLNARLAQDGHDVIRHALVLVGLGSVVPKEQQVLGQGHAHKAVAGLFQLGPHAAVKGVAAHDGPLAHKAQALARCRRHDGDAVGSIEHTGKGIGRAAGVRPGIIIAIR